MFKTAIVVFAGFLAVSCFAHGHGPYRHAHCRSYHHVHHAGAYVAGGFLAGVGAYAVLNSVFGRPVVQPPPVVVPAQPPAVVVPTTYVVQPSATIIYR